MTQNYWDYLRLNLNRQLDVHMHLTQLIEQENELLVANRIALLPEIISQQDFLTSDLAKLQDEKTSIIKNILIDENNPTLTKLIAIAPQEIAQELKQLQDKLKKQADHLNQVSQKNARLIDINIRYVNHMMKTISDETSKDKPVYASNGVVENKERQTVLDYMR
jgi:flagellar biosynthesis/type III secretory pathway chaperone